MTLDDSGAYHAHLTLTAEPDQEFFWGVKDGQGRWLFFEHEASSFSPHQEPEQTFRLGNRHFYGLHRLGRDGFRAALWAPNAQGVDLLVGQDSYPMRSDQGGWHYRAANGWRALRGKPYGYLITTSCGQTVLRADPYARVRQGPQRGVSDLFLNSDGQPSHRYNKDEGGVHLLRFEAQPAPKTRLRHPPTLRLFRDGAALSTSALKKRFSTSQNLPKHEIWWTSRVVDDGVIALRKHPQTNAYSVCLGPEEALRGLSYEIVDSTGHTYHDPWDTTLDGHHNWPRLGLVQDPRQHNSSPVCHQDMRLFEVHVGSILGGGGNLRTSTFGDLGAKLAEIKRLGFNTIALMPTNATEGWRDWGYLGTSTLAHQEAYADPGQDAEQSLLNFLSKAHSLKLGVLTDVVYNHIGGLHNDLWEFDGLENPWFERSHQPEVLSGSLPPRPFGTVETKPRTQDKTVRETPWGPIPAYNKDPVKQFYIDHAMDQLDRLGFDGIRFDFTNLIHASGAGDSEGWEMLRAIHRRVDYFFPQAATFAEEFPPHPGITDPVSEGGAGFSGMWNTEHQHLLIFEHHRSSVTQSLVEDCIPPLGRLLEHLTFPIGFSTPCTSATVLSNHDEVGNAQRLYQLVQTHPRGLDIARLVSWFSLLCPGHPILFQGTEDLASNYFSWGLPHTWDVQSHLSGIRLPKFRARHLQSIKDVLNLRRRTRDLWADHPVAEHYLHEARQLLAIKRGQNWIVGNFGRAAQEVPPHIVNGRRLVGNTEKKAYGYAGKVTRGARIGGYALKVWQ